MATVSDRVRDFYRKHPYPSFGAVVKTKAGSHYQKYCGQPGKFLEAGCGTGHVLAGTASLLPHLEFYAVDLSDASIEIAKRLADERGAKIHFRVHNLMEPLPFNFKFRYISCLGVLHHIDKPETALANLTEKLEDDGYFFLHVYGEDYHHRRLQTKELLDLISSNDPDLERRFELFAAYSRHLRRLKRGSLIKALYRLSLRDLVLGVRKLSRRAFAGASEWELHDWEGEFESPTFSERWLDQFANPNERTYNITQLCGLLASAGLEPVEFFALGKKRSEHLPEGWEACFEALDFKIQARVMELLNPSPTSPFIVARKRR